MLRHWSVAATVAGCLLAAGSELHAQNAHADVKHKIARLAGLPAPDRDELRVWSVSDAADQNYVIVLRARAAGVSGEVVRWWPARYAPDPKWVPPGWRCAKHIVQSDLRLCLASFARAPDWAALLRDFERDDVWSLPDGSNLAMKDKELLVHGADLVVEAHRSGTRRVYTYSLPEFRVGPDAVKAQRVLSRSYAFIDSIGKTGAR